MRLLVVIVLVGCTFKSSMTGGSTSPGGSHSQASTVSGGADDADGAGEAGDPGGPSDRLVLPGLIGKTPDEANAALRAAGFLKEIEVNRMALECVDTKKEVGRISCQNPEAGRLAYRSSTISVTVHEERTIQGALVRAQLVKVRGMTVADARQYLKDLGHDGEVRVSEQPTWSEPCGAGKVCDVEPQSGTGIHDRVTLFINASAKAPSNTVSD
jgi:beta-lactam-binding protein with PASTA domain